MKIPFIDLKPQHQALAPQVRQALVKVFESQQYILGSEGADFEKECEKYLGVKNAVGLASGSDALFLALMALGVGRDDEVITTSFSFFATVSCIVRLGAKPVAADIHPRTFNIDPDQIESKISRKTKAIVVVHLFGQPANMEAILKIARKHSVAVVEDAAQSFGAVYQGKQSGSMGDAGCYSFYPTKNLGGIGDGGLFVSQNRKLAQRVKLLRNHGSKKKYNHLEVGLNSRLDELQAAILRIKLRHVDGWNQKRKRIAQRYSQAFSDLDLKTPLSEPGSQPIYHLYTIQTPKRDRLAKHLTGMGVGCGVYYPLPLHKQPCFKNLAFSKQELPNCERASREVLSLPMFAEMTEPQIQGVIDAVRLFFKKS